MKRVKIKARPDHAERKKRFTQDIEVILGDDIEADYDIVEKDFPDDLPESWADPDDNQEKKIEWFSNFGLKKKSNGKFEDKLPKGQKYQVELPKGRGKMVYFDGESVQKLAGEVKGNSFIGELDLGDPPVGSTDPN